jgi:hypothetical protein
MFRRKHIEHERTLPGVAALRGTAVHAGARCNHDQKKKSFRDLPKSQIIEASVAGFKEAKETEGFRLTPEEMSIGVKPTLARTVDSVAMLAGLYADKIAPGLQPVLVEEQISFTLPGGVTFQGKLDLSTDDKRIKDLKTAGKRKSQKDADDSLQGTLYTLLFRALTGEYPAGFDLEVLVASKEPEVQHLRSNRTERDVAVLINRVNAMIRAMRAGIFSPAAVGSWICGPRFCGFHDTCPFYNAERSAAAVAADR